MADPEPIQGMYTRVNTSVGANVMYRNRFVDRPGHRRGSICGRLTAARTPRAARARTNSNGCTSRIPSPGGFFLTPRQEAILLFVHCQLAQTLQSCLGV